MLNYAFNHRHKTNTKRLGQIFTNLHKLEVAECPESKDRLIPSPKSVVFLFQMSEEVTVKAFVRWGQNNPSQSMA